MSKINLKEGNSPSTPPSGEVSVYVKTDKELYIKNDLGVETPLTNDNEVKVSATDTTSDFLNPKITAGTGISKTILNPAANEQLELSVNEAALTLDNIGGTLSISKGGTGQTSALAAFDALSPLTTKGDILSRDNTNNVRVPVGTDGQILTADSGQPSGLNWTTAGAGSVTSVAMTVPSFLSVAGSPITSSGTLAVSLVSQTQNLVFASPDGAPGNPTFRALLNNDLPTVSIAKGGTGQTTQTAAFNALSPNTTKGDVIVHNGTNNVRQAVGTNGQVLVADSTQTTGVRWGNSFEPANETSFFDEFIGSDQVSLAAAAREISRGWRVDNPGGASTTNYSSAVLSGNHPGIIIVTSGSAGGNYCNLSLASNVALVLGGGQIQFEFLIHIPVLSNATNEYIQRWGFGDTSGANQANGVYFSYDRASSGNFFRIVTANASTRTTTVTGTAVAAGTWYKLRAVINAAGTSVEYFINGISVGTIATNIPTLPISPFMHSIRSAGGPSSFYIDYFYMQQTFTTPR